jgi:cyanophycinase
MILRLLLVALLSLPPIARGQEMGSRGTLIPVGGGLEDDNEIVYARFIELARRATPPGGETHVLIGTAASFDEPGAAKSKRDSLARHAPDLKISVISRPTARDETVALIDSASAIFFTGGDQKRITTRYRPDSEESTPERDAMLRLLARGGVIAGTSAGDAMMGEVMFFTGRSAEALGVATTRTKEGPDDDADDKADPKPRGPQIGRGMGFVSTAMTDSHFLERHRFGRLVAALEASHQRFGIGVSENAAVEIDLATSEMVGLSEAESLLVDVRELKREGLTRKGIRAKVIARGMRFNLRTGLVPPVQVPSQQEFVLIKDDDSGTVARQFFLAASEKPMQLDLDGYAQKAWKIDQGWLAVDVEVPSPAPPAPELERYSK